MRDAVHMKPVEYIEFIIPDNNLYNHLHKTEFHTRIPFPLSKTISTPLFNYNSITRISELNYHPKPTIDSLLAIPHADKLKPRTTHAAH